MFQYRIVGNMLYAGKEGELSTDHKTKSQNKVK